MEYHQSFAACRLRQLCWPMRFQDTLIAIIASGVEWIEAWPPWMHSLSPSCQSSCFCFISNAATGTGTVRSSDAGKPAFCPNSVTHCATSCCMLAEDVQFVRSWRSDLQPHTQIL